MKQFAPHKLLRSALPVVMLAFVLSSCGNQGSSLMRLVPQDSCAILSIDWSAIRTERNFRRVLKAKELEDSLSGLQIPDESIKTIIVFSGFDSKENSGLLLRGTFDPKKVVSALNGQGWRQETLDGSKVYVNSSQYVALTSSNTLFAGTREAARAVFRAQRSLPDSIVASPSYKKINLGIPATESKPLKAFLLIPQGTLDMADAALTATSFALSVFDLGGIGQLLKAVNVARGLAFSLDHGNHNRYPVELSVLMRDEQAAIFVSGSLNAMKGLSELAAADTRDQQVIREFRNMSIKRSGEVLAVRMDMPAAALFPP